MLDLNLFSLQLPIILVLPSEIRHLTLGFWGCWKLRSKDTVQEHLGTDSTSADPVKM